MSNMLQVTDAAQLGCMKITGWYTVPNETEQVLEYNDCLSANKSMSDKDG